MGLAKCANGTVRTFWRLWRANCCSQLHQRLIEITRMFRINRFISKFPVCGMSRKCGLVVYVSNRHACWLWVWKQYVFVVSEYKTWHVKLWINALLSYQIWSTAVFDLTSHPIARKREKTRETLPSTSPVGLNRFKNEIHSKHYPDVLCAVIAAIMRV